MNNITRLFDFPYNQLEKYNLPDALVTKYNGEWVKTSTKEYLDKANAISRGLIRLGVNKNDKIIHGCGCRLDAKARLFDEKCILNKW